MSEPRKIFVGVIETEPGEALAIDIPPNADAATVQAAITKANLERAAAAKCESERLKALFMPDAKKGTELS